MKKLLQLFNLPLIGIILFSISFIFYALFVLNFEPHTDDEFLGEQLYWLLKDGHVRSNLMAGFRNIGIENIWTVFHKGIIYWGYVWSKGFGWSTFSLQFSSIILSLGFIFLLWKYFKKSDNKFSKNAFYLVCSVAFLFYYFTWSSTRFRPEMLELVLGFGVFMSLSAYLSNNKMKMWVLAAILAGLAMLAHVNGLIIIFGGFSILIFNKKWQTAFLFGTFASFVFFATYFADVLILTDLNYFQTQFLNDPALNSSHFHWYSPFLKIPGELSRYFHADVDAAFAGPFFVVFIMSFKYLKTKRRNMVIYLLSMMLLLSFYTYNKKTVFMVPLFPYMAILFVEGVHYLVKEKSQTFYSKIAVGLFLIYFPIGMYLMTVKTIKLYNSNILAENKEIGEIIGENNRVLAEGKFIFNEIKKQEFIINETQFTFFRSFHGQPYLTLEQLCDTAYKMDLDYIIFRQPMLGLVKDGLNDSIPNTLLIENNSQYSIVQIVKEK